MTDYARLYAGQDYMTPGAVQTVDIIADAVPFDDAPWLLEMASGKGTAAATPASGHLPHCLRSSTTPRSSTRASTGSVNSVGGMFGWSRGMAAGYRSGPAYDRRLLHPLPVHRFEAGDD